MSDSKGMSRQPDELLRLLRELQEELEQLLRGLPASGRGRGHVKTRSTDSQRLARGGPHESTDDVADPGPSQS